MKVGSAKKTYYGVQNCRGKIGNVGKFQGKFLNGKKISYKYLGNFKLQTKNVGKLCLGR